MSEKFSKRTISNSRIGSYLLGPIYEMGSITKNQSLKGLRVLHEIGIGKMVYIDMVTYLIICKTISKL
jgi:hypothetical protein